jgi:hypothetical protein
MTMQTEAEIVNALQRIADSLEEQNKFIEKSINTSQRILATHILNIKIQARVGVALNALDVLTHKEFLDIVNQI